MLRQNDPATLHVPAPVVPAQPPGSSGAGARHHQVWFGDPERPRYGWLSVPADGRARGGVVLCSPVGEEGRASHRTFRRLAEDLAEAGLLALRFDYDGSGDSAGGQLDPDRVAGWLASIEDARRLVREAGPDRVAAVGMRLGATLAARAAAGAAFDDLVLWDPVPSGRAFLRAGEALYSFGEDADRPDDGLRHTPGFQYDADTARDLARLDLTRLPVAQPWAGRVLLLERDDRPTHPGVAARLAQEPGRVDRLPARDQADLLELPPSDCLVPERTLAEVVAWLAVGTRTSPPRPVVVPRTGSAVVGAGPAGVVHERSTLLGTGDGRPGLYSVVSETAEAVSAGRRPWVVLVNVATEHHIGPGRRWVELAREWAGLGYRCVRLDQSGVGDGPHREGRRDDLGFDPDWLVDLPAALSELGADGDPVVVVGLCSGAYSALEAALASRVDAVFAINPRLTLYQAARGTEAWSPDRRAAAIPVRPIARLALRRRILAGALWRVYRQVVVRHAPYRALERVVRRGTVLEVVAHPDDHQHFTEVLFWRPWLRRLRRDPRFALTCSPGLDHSLLQRSAQEEVRARATDFLERRFPLPRRSG